MQKTLLYILPLIIIFISCKEPLPTQLVEPNTPNNTKVEIEPLSPEPDLFAYEGGYDTLGYVPSTPIDKAIINVSGIKSTYKRVTTKRTTAFAIYTNKDKRIERKDKRLIGFFSDYVGETSFNNIKAVAIKRRIKYKWNGSILDTLLGVIHMIPFSRRRTSLYPFPYNSSISFRLKIASGNRDISILTPTEITGKIKTEGTVGDKNLKINLEWNASRESKITIIIGGMNPNSRAPFPLFKIQVRDNGKVTIPKSLMRTFPFNRFKQVMCSFVRQKFVGNPKHSKEIIVAQSIHNIRFDVPQ